MPKSKRCPACCETKPASEWHRNQQNKSGLATYCKPCSSEWRKVRYRKRLALLTIQPSDPLTVPTCAVDGCERPTALGSWTAVGQWCSMHHARWYRHGDPLKVVGVAGADRGTPCKVSGCDRASNHRGWCGMHYQRVLRKGSAGVAKSRFFTGDERCSVPACDKPEWCGRYCVGHYTTYVSGPKRRALMAGARTTPFTAEQLAQRMEYWGRKCWVCSGPFEAIDHVKPLSKGGPHMLANFRPICTDCNSRKGAKWPYAPLRRSA